MVVVGMDDWSLKGKIELLDYMEYGETTSGNYLHESHIEILRQKLIDDVNSHREPYAERMKYQASMQINDVIRYINKRFGVDEE